ncbi:MULTISPECIES: hypothetical protein [Undibacterium]|uniref:Uncharacterized protein n=1 Tax=Undibacterium umbellatum TaxID=2762300 RepID=A0ABR6Z8F4_9BURK|nr:MULTISPECIES: hypothetical protein [Undibacterium]MBC3908058.1 hypothetical protein [Undibacterium umbellatum]MDP1980529.1 hypothetical protein [Undibacterium sp.]
MKIYSEIIVLYAHVAMPGEDDFCPAFWQAEEFDSDGDFYGDDVAKDWTTLKLTKHYANGRDSDFQLYVHREKGGDAAHELARFIQYRKDGHYKEKKQVHEAKNLCVASLQIRAASLEDYREFLRTVHFFLEHTGGIAANVGGFDAWDFKTEFVD